MGTAIYTRQEVDFSLKKTMHPRAGAVITYLGKNGLEDPTSVPDPWKYRFPPVEQPEKGDPYYVKEEIDASTGRLREGCHEWLKSPYFYDISTSIIFLDNSNNSTWKWQTNDSSVGGEYIKCNATIYWTKLPEPTEE